MNRMAVYIVLAILTDGKVGFEEILSKVHSYMGSASSPNSWAIAVRKIIREYKIA